LRANGRKGRWFLLHLKEKLTEERGGDGQKISGRMAHVKKITKSDGRASREKENVLILTKKGEVRQGKGTLKPSRWKNSQPWERKKKKKFQQQKTTPEDRKEEGKGKRGG